jgi:RNA polymerase primary sigma factor
MPQARSGGSRSTSGSRGTSAAKRTTGAKTSGAKSTSGTRSTAAKRSTASTSRSTAKKPAAGAAKKSSAGAAKKSSASAAKKPSASAAEARLDAAAQRLRKLNERIIDAGKDAGESTLTSYETALKAIASAIEKGPGSSEVEWVSNLATTQAKFIRDVTAAWTKAARARLK